VAEFLVFFRGFQLQLLPDELVRLLTAHNVGETGLQTQFGCTDAQKDAGYGSTHGRESITVAAVGVTSEKFSPDHHSGLVFVARTVDSIIGKVGFNWQL
jgi:hypothetical protein